MRNARLTHVSLLAIAVTLMSMPRAAQAQSFNANGEVVAGAGLVDNATPGQTNVFLDSPNAVVNWTLAVPAGSGPFVFQPAGTTATFTNRDSTSFTVLNRIISTGSPRAMQFNGTVVSQLTDLATGSVSRGGTLFFYSPNGIVVGSTGVFNVGNLVLTSSDLGYDPVTGEFGKGGIYSFLPANAGSSVEVRKGAQIIAGPTNAYVGLVAPKVVNSGTITVDGSAVLVAADASTITFRPNGLFDIQIDLGTSATGEVVTNDGTITGTVGSVNVAHRLYVVAVPRNDAITMAIKGGSKLGFDIAVAAGEEDGAIVLSAGYDIADGVLAGVRSPNGGAGPAALTIGAIDATSPLTGQATGQALLQVEGGKAANFASDVSIAGVSDPSGASADGAIVSVSGVGSTLDIAGDLLVRSLDGGIVTGSGVSDANAARIVVSDGRMTVLGNATADASRNGYAGQVSQGGEAALVASGNAVVEVGKDLVLSGDAIGQAVDDASTLGSFSGIGGNAHLSLGSGASVTVDGNLAVHAAGSGGDVGTSGYVGADGTGGTAVVEGLAGGGALTVAGTLAVDATGTGANGNTCTACVVEGGLGTGGTAGISAAAGITLTITGATSVDASGQGGAATADKGKTGGAGLGGAAFVRSTGGAVIAGGPLSVLANGTGGAGALTDSAVSGATGSGGTGGAGTGGTARLTAGDAATIGGGGSIAIAGTAMVSASGAGGAGGTGGAGLGGTAALSARNGKVTGTNLSTRALGLGGAGSNGGNGGAGSGGTAALMAYSALEGDAAVTFGTTVITARGTGGAGAAPELLADAGGAGGLGTGGTASAMAEAGNGSVVLGVTSINASGGGGIGGAGGAGFSGTGGAGGAGGTGRGGTATIGVTSGLDTGAVNTGSAAFDGTSVLANGNGGTGGAGGIGSVTGAAGTGGNAQGGGAALMAQGGTVTLLAAAQVRADAQGGSGGLGSGGNAAIGDDGSAADPRGVRLVVGNRTGHADQKGQLTGAALEFSAGASAGKGATQGTATNLGHPLTFLLDGGAIDATSLDFAGRGVSAALAPPSVIDLAGGDTTLTGAFRFVTPGTLAAALGGADVFSDTALVSASDWLPGAAPAGPSGTIHGTTGVSLLTSGNLFAFLSAETGGSLALTASGLIRLDALTATGSITVNAGTSLLLADVTAGGDASLVATGTVGLGNVGAGGDAVLTSGGALAAGAVTTGQSAVIDGASSIALGGDVVAGDSVQLVSDGAVNGKGLSAGLVSPSAASGATYEITVFSNGAVGLGALSAARDIKLFTPVDLTVGALSGREIAVLAGGPQSIGSIAATGRVLLADYAMTPSGGNPLAGYDLDALFAAAPIASGAAITVRGSATAGSLTATTTSDLSAGTIAATGGILLQAGGALATGDLGGSVVSLAAGTTLTAGDISATDGAVTLRAAGDMTAGSISAVGSVSLASTGGKVTIATVGAAGDVTLVAASDVEAGALTAGGLLLSSGANVALGDTQGSRITVSANGDLSIGGVAATSGRAELTAVGALSSGAITAATRIALSSGAALTTGDLTAGGALQAAAVGNALVGAVSSNSGTVELRSTAGSLTTGTVRAATDTALVAATDLAVGAVSARDMVLLAGGGLRAASLTSSGGRILLAGAAMVAAGGPIGGFDYDAVFAAPLQSAGGAVTLTGAVSGGAFTAGMDGDASLSGITAARTILVDSGGTVSVGGVWRAPQIEIRANDLAMSAGAGLDAGVAGTISLVSRNAAGLRIGDGLDGSVVPASGYTLDNAEWGRIKSGSFSVFGLDGAGPVDMLIGKLDVTGTDAGSTIGDPAGTVLFRTGSLTPAAASGTIRVAGVLGASGFREGNALAFQTGLFQLASDTGSIAVLGKTDALSGAVRIEAGDIHIAAGSLLARLAADPFFAGVESALDTQSAGGSQPALRAGALDLAVGRTLYIQRNGSGDDPLGFEDPLEGFKVRVAGASPITVIINGTFRTASGPVGGIEAWKLFKASGADLSGFTADSRLNGCLLNAATCVAKPPVVRPDPDPGVRTLIGILDDPRIDETPADEPRKRQPRSANAILPPQTILAVQPDALPVQIDEPIAGSGNPALTGAEIGMAGGPVR